MLAVAVVTLVNDYVAGAKSAILDCLVWVYVQVTEYLY